MRSLVTGARGFIGSFLVEELLQLGHEVRCILRDSRKGRAWLEGLDIEVVSGDINDPESLVPAVQDVDLVFHLAGVTKAVNKAEFERVNVDGTRNMLEALQQYNPEVRRFVLVSSLAATGPSRDKKPLSETVKPVPVSDYGESKLQAENLTLAYNDIFPVCITRPPAVFGPRDTDIFEIFKNTDRGVRPVMGGGPRLVSAIYVHDLVAGLLLAATEEEARGQTYFLCNDSAYALDELEETIARIMGKNPLRIPVPLPLAAVVSGMLELIGRLTNKPTIINLDKFKELKQTHWICDNAKARRELGFKPKYELGEALRTTAKWYADNGWL